MKMTLINLDLVSLSKFQYRFFIKAGTKEKIILDLYQKQTSVFQKHIVENDLAVAVLYDLDNLYYFS
jgi:hypothetical protein